MDQSHRVPMIGRRGFIAGAAALGALHHPTGALGAMARDADEAVFTTAFPQKGRMILQRTRPPLLETPFEVFDQGVYTPNDRFFVRWHWAGIPEQVDVATFTLTVHGHVDRPLTLGLGELLAMPRIEYAAVNQCSGNSRSLFSPRVGGAQWRHGAMGNARWVGVPLKAVLDRAGVKAGAVAIRARGLDEPVVPDAPAFAKSLAIDHARDGEVMIAFQMNGEQLPLLNGFPLRLVVPGWYSTYWVKMLSDIEVLAAPDDQYWTKMAYRIPDTPHASVAPGQAGYAQVPINRMVPRSFITNLVDGAQVAAGKPLALRGLAFGGDQGVAKVEVSADGGGTWRQAQLAQDEGRYSFRQWHLAAPGPTAGPVRLMARCTNTAGETQPLEANWNPNGFMRNVVETTTLTAA
ncbi:molybdopterin-dependent oxidoreductase [Nitrospirillum viridazoti]|uniref:Oxidase n=1 Tax=Nitrospirillum viridazoti CBAmc TaxID=1441467 RepID=A0A248JY28_9PROT|nr:molybdopterin-dependent oxidoreductase [Nitrospirillum amazonense]ASG23104.1 oxidase [Nitrospirillum amazonense CBAmc]TWB38841.1 DMSO/TMAO reductase YedYZ molybdopterin-dependent catalytic subunit [Nitrospirillum amazonense]